MRIASPNAPIQPRSCPEPRASTPPLTDSSLSPLVRLPATLLGCGLAAGALLGSVIGGMRTGWADVEPKLPIPVAGSRTLPVALRVLIVLDESGSTSSTDPTHESHRATLLVCDWLANYSQNPDDRVGLVRFADRADVVAPVRATRARKTFEKALESGRSVGGGTQLTPAIDELLRLLADRRAERDVVLLITDGQVAEPDAELRALIGRLRSQADATYLLALADDGAWTKQTHRRYDGLGLNGTIPIGRLTSGRLAHAIATVLIHEAGLETARRQ